MIEHSKIKPITWIKVFFNEIVFVLLEFVLLRGKLHVSLWFHLLSLTFTSFNLNDTKLQESLIGCLKFVLKITYQRNPICNFLFPPPSKFSVHLSGKTNKTDTEGKVTDINSLVFSLTFLTSVTVETWTY